MTLEDLGNVGEFIASLGVLISLIYLAFQVKENSRYIQENSAFLRATNEITSNDNVTVTRQILFDHSELIIPNMKFKALPAITRAAISPLRRRTSGRLSRSYVPIARCEWAEH